MIAITAIWHADDFFNMAKARKMGFGRVHNLEDR